jgi:hypothetical protein
MGKWANDSMMDAALNYIDTNVTQLVVCSSQPTTYAEANSTYALADVAIDGTDVTLEDGDTSGRKATIAAQSSITVDTGGTAEHIALTSADTLLYVTTCTSQSLSAGSSVNTPAFDIEIADPS